MSSAVFPEFAGLDIVSRKIPMFSSEVQRTVSGRETRAAFMTYPLWRFYLTYKVLRSDTTNAELQSMLDFFLARRGQYDDFLYTDPDDNAVTAEPFGTGDASTASFQLIRKFKAGGFSEPVQNLNGAPTIYVAGVAKTAGVHYNIGSTGLVTFTVGNIPTAGQALTWDGAYYFRCRFMQDEMEFSKFLHQLFEVKRIEFVSVKL